MSKSVSVGRVSLLVWLPSRREKACLFFMTRLCARLGGKASLFSTETANRREGAYTPKKANMYERGMSTKNGQPPTAAAGAAKKVNQQR